MNFIYNGKFGGCEITPTEIKTKTGTFNLNAFNKWHETLNWKKIGENIQTSFPYLKVVTNRYGLVLTLGTNSYFVSCSDKGLDWTQNNSKFLAYSLKSYVLKNTISDLNTTPKVQAVETPKKVTTVAPKITPEFINLKKICKSHNFFFNGWKEKQLLTLLTKTENESLTLESGSIFLKSVYDILLEKSPKSEYVPVGRDSYILGTFDMSFCIYKSELNLIKGTCTECIKYKNWGTWSSFLTTVMPSFINYLAKVHKKSVACGGYDIINPFGVTIAEKKKQLEAQNVDATKDLEQLQTNVLTKTLILSKRDQVLNATENKLNKKESAQTYKNKQLDAPEFKRVVTVTVADNKSEMYKWYRAKIEVWAEYLRSLDGIKEIKTQYAKTTTSVYVYVTGENGKTLKLSLRDHGNMSQESIYVILVHGFNLDGVHKDVLNLFNMDYKIDLNVNIPYIESKSAVFFKYLQVRNELNKKAKRKNKVKVNKVGLDIFEKEDVQMGGIN